jgi:hypothetical protein
MEIVIGAYYLSRTNVVVKVTHVSETEVTFSRQIKSKTVEGCKVGIEDFRQHFVFFESSN